MPPRRRPVSYVAVQEDERWPVASAFVGDAEPVNLDYLHRTLPRGFGQVTFAQMRAALVACLVRHYATARHTGGRVLKDRRLSRLLR
jgi:hypothetical protein